MANTKVTGEVIANGTISTVHIADDAITAAKLDSTATGITFADLAVSGNSTLTGYVGIGTSTPGTLHSVNYGATKLHIDGGTDRGQIILEGDTFANIVMSDNGATANSRVFLAQVNDGLMHFKSVNDNGTSKATIMSMTSSGNVGINETSPSGKLHIKGSDTGATPSAQGNSLVLEDSENGLSILSSTAGAGYINFGDSNDNNIGMIIYDHSSNSMRTWVNATERMRIDSSGLVRIQKNTASTTEPLLKLSNASGSTTDGVKMIFEIANTSGNGGEIAVVRDGGSFNPYMTFNVSSGVASAPTERMRIDSSGQVEMLHSLVMNKTDGSYIKFEYNGATRGYIGSERQIFAGGSEANMGYAAIGDLVFGTGGSLTERMRIDTSGNIGIGRTDPNARLDIKGAGGTTGLTFETSDASNNQTFWIKDGGSAGLRYYPFSIGYESSETIPTSNGLAIKHGTPTIHLTDSSSSGTFSLKLDGVNTTLQNFSTNGHISLITNGAGNVGIGTTSPQNKLDIYSNENVPLRVHRPSNANLNSSGAWGIGFSTRGDAITSTDDVRAGIFSYYNGNLFFATNTTDIEPDPDASARMTILNNGNVGIGTTNPQNKFVVANGTDNTQNIEIAPNYIQSFNRQSGNLGYASLDFYANSYTFNVTDVLIGTNGKFLQGRRSTGSTVIDMIGFGAGTDTLQIKGGTSGGANAISFYDTGGFLGTFYNGNLGIGNTLPNNKLEISDTGTGTGSTHLKISRGADSSAVQRIAGIKMGNTASNDGSNWIIQADSSLGYFDNANLDFIHNAGGTPSTRMRIDSSGRMLVGTQTRTGNYDAHYYVRQADGSYVMIISNTQNDTDGQSALQLNLVNTSATTNSYFLICRQGPIDTGTNRFIIYANGNAVNSNNSYGAISDSRLKENIIDATPKLDQLMQIPVKNFNLIGDNKKQIGIIAQDVEQIFPGIIDENKLPDSEDETLYKSVKYSVLVPMLLKGIQEQQEIINDLKNRIQTLENN